MVGEIDRNPLETPHMTLNEIAIAAHTNSRNKGFWDGQIPGTTDPQIAEWRAFVAAWAQAGGSDATTADLLILADANGLFRGEMDPQIRRFGRMLDAVHGQVFAGYKLCRRVRSGSLVWRLEHVDRGIDVDLVRRTIPEKLALIHSEVSEALEDYRDGVMTTTVDEKGKPIGFPSELADILIRVGDLAEALGIDLDEEVSRKMRFNATRPRMHGKVC